MQFAPYDVNGRARSLITRRGEAGLPGGEDAVYLWRRDAGPRLGSVGKVDESVLVSPDHRLQP